MYVAAVSSRRHNEQGGGAAKTASAVTEEKKSLQTSPLTIHLMFGVRVSARYRSEKVFLRGPNGIRVYAETEISGGGPGIRVYAETAVSGGGPGPAREEGRGVLQ